MKRLSIEDLGKDQIQKALDLHKKAIVVDACVLDCTIEDEKYFDEFRNGADVANLCSLVTGGYEGWGVDFEYALNNVEKFATLIEKNSDKMVLVTAADQIEQAKKEGKVGVILGFQDTRPIGTDLGLLRVFYRLGVRIIQLTYNSQNFVGSGYCEIADGGLTLFGREVVEEMNRLGVVIDLSHCNERTTSEAIEYSKKPVAVTHANARSVCPVPGRNKTDEQIKALAEKGGVIGVVISPRFVKEQGDLPEHRPTIDDVLDHVDHIANLVGADHIGFGLDLGRKYMDQGVHPPYSAAHKWPSRRPGVGGVPLKAHSPRPLGIERHTEFVNLTKGLVARGYSDQETIKILGGNFLRLFRAIF